MKTHIFLFACCLFATSFAQPINHHPHRLTILLDAGHGENTPGKCSPDGEFREFSWNRAEVHLLGQCLSGLGFNVINLVPEDFDVPINDRVKLVNKLCGEHGVANCILVSIHCNAAPGKGWHSARGFMPFVAKENASLRSKRLAQNVFDEAARRNLLGNRMPPSERYWTREKTGILRATHCPSILVECGFMDNHEDLEFLKSDHGRQTVVELIVEAILAYETDCL